MNIPWKDANEGLPVSEEQYQERFWRRRLDGIGLDTATKEFLDIEFKRTQDARSNYVERATAVAQEQYKSLLTGLQAVGQVKGWTVQQVMCVGGTSGSIHVKSLNRNMMALGFLESKWDPIRKNFVRRLVEEQDKVLRSYFAQKEGTRSKGQDRSNRKGREHVQRIHVGHVCVKIARADRGQVTNSRSSGENGNRGCFVCLLFSLVWFVKFIVN
jgi:hypothetical protein